jgi:hypothetical protein
MDRYHLLDEHLEDENFQDYIESLELVSKYAEVTKGLKEDPLGWKWTTEKIRNYLRENGYV